MTQPAKTPESSKSSVAWGCLLSGVAALVTFGTAIMIMAPMSWAAVFVFAPMMGIATIAWIVIVSVANRGNADMWGGTLLFAAFAMAGFVTFILLDKNEQSAKREADIKLGESLATSRLIDNPIGPIDRLAVTSMQCGHGVCGHALMFGMAKEVVTISRYKNWITYYRLQPIGKCPTYNDSGAAYVAPLQQIGIFDACLRRMKKVQSDPYSEIKNAVLISYQSSGHERDKGLFPSRHIYGVVARKMENRHITEELARWEYFHSGRAQRSFGKRFNQTEFVAALTGMEADMDKAFVRRSFSDAVRHIKEKIGLIKMEYRAIFAYLQKLVRDARAETGEPVIVTKATDDELQAIIEHLCFARTSEKNRCSTRLEYLRSEYNMEIRP
ncbi:MAG: hypothetical protein HKP56_16810 [Anderseniella sp.]|nr:hypothetical protein [Anderseniella sp.]